MPQVVRSDRQHSRHRLRTRCVITASESGEVLGDETLDISWDGARVKAIGCARVGQRIRARVQIPRSTVWIEAEGYVARLMPARRSGDGEPAFGVRLDRMDGMMRLLLATSFRHRPAPEPTHRGKRRDYAEMVWRIHTDG